MTCKAEKAFPSSAITWYFGPSNPVNFSSPKFKGAFELISETGPSQIGGTFTSSQTVRYTARTEDHQITVYCKATQVDDENNVEETASSQSFTLFVPPPSLPLHSSGWQLVLQLEYLCIYFFQERTARCPRCHRKYLSTAFMGT